MHYINFVKIKGEFDAKKYEFGVQNPYYFISKVCYKKILIVKNNITSAKE